MACISLDEVSLLEMHMNNNIDITNVCAFYFMLSSCAKERTHSRPLYRHRAMFACEKLQLARSLNFFYYHVHLRADRFSILRRNSSIVSMLLSSTKHQHNQI